MRVREIVLGQNHCPSSCPGVLFQMQLCGTEALFILALFIHRKYLLMPDPPPCMCSFDNLSRVGGRGREMRVSRVSSLGRSGFSGLWKASLGWAGERRRFLLCNN